jgi:hypothetical protein
MSVVVKLQDIHSSPYNPKEPFTKKQIEALKRNIKKFGFARDLVICNDFNTGEGYICLDGNSALDILREMGYEEFSCKIIDKVVDYDALVEFVTAYAISKKPLINEMFKVLGGRLEEIYGKSAAFFDEMAKSNASALTSMASGNTEPPKAGGTFPEKPPIEQDRTCGYTPENSGGYKGQRQYFLTLPEDCVQRLKGFIKTKAYQSSKSEAIAAKIDAMDETVFLENLFQIIL